MQNFLVTQGQFLKGIFIYKKTNYLNYSILNINRGIYMKKVILSVLLLTLAIIKFSCGSFLDWSAEKDEKDMKKNRSVTIALISKRRLCKH